jgi:hypothetical protein
MQLNFFPIAFEFDEYNVDKTDYTQEKLTNLRKSHNSTHSFFRNGDNIYVSNDKSSADLNIGLLPTTQKVYEDWVITSSLIKHVFFRAFRERFFSYVPVDFYPFRFFSSNEKDDLLFNLLPTNLRNSICYKKMIEVQCYISAFNFYLSPLLITFADQILLEK